MVDICVAELLYGILFLFFKIEEEVVFHWNAKDKNRREY